MDTHVPRADMTDAEWTAVVRLDRIPKAGWNDVFEVVDVASGERLEGQLVSVGTHAVARVRRPTPVR